MRIVLLSTVAIFVVWSFIDFLVHGIMLEDIYGQTAHLWRSVEEVQDHWGVHVVTLASAFLFSWIFYCYSKEKSLKHGVAFGAKLGVMCGLLLGYGMYCVMPIPLTLATVWFLSSVLSMTIAGVIATLSMREFHYYK